MALALLDPLSNFLGLLEVVIVILIIVESARAFGAGGSGVNVNFGGIGKLFGTERKAETEEEKEATEAEKAEVAEIRDIQKIEKIEKREIQDAKKISADIDTIIKILKSGNIRKDSFEKIRNMVGGMQPTIADIRTFYRQLVSVVRELEAVENIEISEIQQAFEKAKQATRAFVGTGNVNKLNSVEQKVMNDANQLLAKKVNETRNNLEAKVKRVGVIENSVVGAFNEAMGSISAGKLNVAIARLEQAKQFIDELEEIINLIEKTSINKIKNEIRKELSDLKNEEYLAKKIKKAVG